MLLPKAWLGDCVTSRFMRFLCYALLDLFVHQIWQPSRLRTTLFSVLQQARITLYQLRFLGVGSVCGLGLDLVGIHSLSLAARYRVVACSTTHSRGLEKISTARRHNCTPLFALSLSPIWEKEFLVPSMAFSTANAFDTICRLHRNDTLDEVPQNNKQKVATGLLLDKLHKQDFAGPLACRASKVSGPISRHRVADILPHMKIVSRASRPGLLVFLPSHPL